MKRVGKIKWRCKLPTEELSHCAYQITVIATPLSCHGTALNSCGG
uniref:Uncharacterized protein n=1 Tax=Anguilla anguilla TaxID=7936 RepID=A0A0E9Q7Y8_ANGAN